jgi:hypothetical protein
MNENSLVGAILSAGYINPRWMFVTKVDGQNVYGRLWSARSQTWTKTSALYSRDALGKKTPRCPKPTRPRD